MEGITNLAGMARQTRQRGYLAVRRDPASGDPADHCVDALITHE
jgi:hypothetical protein